MTLKTADPGAARSPGCDYGGHGAYGKSDAAHLYGQPGERCHKPGCNAILRGTNKRDRCDCHGVPGKLRKPRKRGEVASAGSSAVATAAPPPRRTTQEDIEMAARERQVKRDRRQVILGYLNGLQDREAWTTGRTIAHALDIPQGSMSDIMGRLVEDGVLESRIPQKGGGYRLRQDAAAKAAEAACEDEQTEMREQEVASDVIMVFASDPDAQYTADDLLTIVAGDESFIRAELERLVAKGDLTQNGEWYHWPTIKDAEAASAAEAACDIPDDNNGGKVTPPDTSPVKNEPIKKESPAQEAVSVDKSVDSQEDNHGPNACTRCGFAPCECDLPDPAQGSWEQPAGPPPFAGQWSHPLVFEIPADTPLVQALARCTRALERLDPKTRENVLLTLAREYLS